MNDARSANELSCACCGMPIKSQNEYHPFAACLMFTACHNSETVRDNLQAVVEYGRGLEHRGTV